MSLYDDLLAQLQPFSGRALTPALAVTATDPVTNVGIELRVLTVDAVGVSLESLQLTAPHLAGANADLLKKWANALCQRVSYLLENLGPLEIDSQGQQVLIRSQPPTATPTAKKYYEVLLSSLGAGRFSLRRYQAEIGIAGRNVVPLQITFEYLEKLLDDLLATLPAKP